MARVDLGRQLQEQVLFNLFKARVDSALCTICRVICKCINTPVKRQYISTHFEVGVYLRKNHCHWLVLISRGSHLILVEKSSLALKWQNLKVEVSLFLTFYVIKLWKNVEGYLSRSGISKPVKIFLPNLNENPMISMLMGDQKLMSVATFLQS